MLISMVLPLSAMVRRPDALRSVRQAREQAFQLQLGALDAFIQALGVVLRRRQLLPQVMVLGAQPLAQPDELRDLGLEGVELRVHGGTIFQIYRSVKK